MIGWNIGVYRQVDAGALPATQESTCGERVAIWQTDEYGLGWIRDLVQSGNAVDLGGDGYPNLFTVRAKLIIPKISHNPPRANEVWLREDFDSVMEDWVGKTAIDHDVIARCDPDEWVMIVAWDES